MWTIQDCLFNIYVLLSKQQIGIDKGHYWQKLKKEKVIGFASKYVLLAKIVHAYYVKGTYFNI